MQYPCQKAIYQIWAEKVGRGFAYHGRIRYQGQWERLDAKWVREEFAPYGTWLKTLENNSGKPLCVPEGRVALSAALEAGISDSHGGLGDLPGVVVPSVDRQEQYPYCAVYGPTSALKHLGLTDRADQLKVTPWPLQFKLLLALPHKSRFHRCAGKIG